MSAVRPQDKVRGVRRYWDPCRVVVVSSELRSRDDTGDPRERSGVPSN